MKVNVVNIPPIVRPSKLKSPILFEQPVSFVSIKTEGDFIGDIRMTFLGSHAIVRASAVTKDGRIADIVQRLERRDKVFTLHIDVGNTPIEYLQLFVENGTLNHIASIEF